MDKNYMLQVYIPVIAVDDVDARIRANMIVADLIECVANDEIRAVGVTKVNLKEIRDNQEPRIIDFKPCLD